MFLFKKNCFFIQYSCRFYSHKSNLKYMLSRCNGHKVIRPNTTTRRGKPAAGELSFCGKTPLFSPLFLVKMYAPPRYFSQLASMCVQVMAWMESLIFGAKLRNIYSFKKYTHNIPSSAPIFPARLMCYGFICVQVKKFFALGPIEECNPHELDKSTSIRMSEIFPK